jgi:hypothetical protein
MNEADPFLDENISRFQRIDATRTADSLKMNSTPVVTMPSAASTLGVPDSVRHQAPLLSPEPQSRL